MSLNEETKSNFFSSESVFTQNLRDGKSATQGQFFWGAVLVWIWLAQSGGAVEYTDCISAGGNIPPASVLDMTQNNLMVRLQ